MAPFVALAFGLCAAMSADGTKVDIGYQTNGACEFQHHWSDHTYGYLDDLRAFVELLDGGATIGIEDLEFTIVGFEEA